MNRLLAAVIACGISSVLLCIAAALAGMYEQPMYFFIFAALSVASFLCTIGLVFAYYITRRGSEVAQTSGAHITKSVATQPGISLQQSLNTPQNLPTTPTDNLVVKESETPIALTNSLVLKESATSLPIASTPFSVACGNTQLQWSALDSNSASWNMDGMWCNSGVCADNTAPVSTAQKCNTTNPCSFKPTYDNVNTIPTAYRLSLPDSSGITYCWDVRVLIQRILQGLNNLQKVVKGMTTLTYLSPNFPDKYYGTDKKFTLSDMDVIKSTATGQGIRLPVTFDILRSTMKNTTGTSALLAGSLLAGDMHFLLYDPSTGKLAELKSVDEASAVDVGTYTAMYGWVDKATFTGLDQVNSIITPKSQK